MCTLMQLRCLYESIPLECFLNHVSCANSSESNFHILIFDGSWNFSYDFSLNPMESLASYPIFLNQRQESISFKKKGKKKQESLKNIILKKLAKLYQYIGNQEKCVRTYHRVEKFTSSINLKNVLTYQTFMMFMISHIKNVLWFSWSYSSAFVLLGFFLIHDYVLGASKTLHLPPLSIKCT